MVIVLSMVVLLTFLTLAFLSRATIERQVSYSNLSRGRADIMARSITSVLVAELLDEMRYGNLSTDISGVTLDTERRLTNSFPASATNVSPQKVLGDNQGKTCAINLFKMSLNGKVSYPKILFTDGPADTTKIAAWGGSTTTASRNGRAMTAKRWNYLGLLPDTTTFTPPDWIRMSRNGPETYGAKVALSDAKNPAKANYIIGRYSYIMANLGGMLDINMIGNGYPVNDSRNTSRRRLHQANFTAIRGSSESALDEKAIRERLVQWRWKDKYADDTWLFDSTRDFLHPTVGHNVIFSRMELLAFQKQNSDILNFTDLAYLTVGSYEKNLPAFDKENHNAAGFDQSVNQSLSRTFYTTGTKKGQRVMSQRFNLNRIDLLKSGSTSDILKYFGLKQNGSTDDWIYAGTAASSGRPIRTFKDIAADATNPEPNFFEILKAVINRNTLGVEQDGGRQGSYTVAQSQRVLPDYQIFQIGANIIDQWDADDDPTCIQSSDGDKFYGVENLPYLNQVLQWGACTPMDEDKWPTNPHSNRRFNTWFVPELWNPNRDASSSTVTEFRFVGASSSKITSQVKTYVYTANPVPPDTSISSQQVFNSVIDISKCSITFTSTDTSNTSNKFADPSIVRNGVPSIDTGAVVSADAGSDTHAVADSKAMMGSGTINFLGIWGGETDIPDTPKPANGSNGYTLGGSKNFGFELQYKKNGSWRTYQIMDRFKQGVGAGVESSSRGLYNQLVALNSFAVSDPRCHRTTRSVDISGSPYEAFVRNANTTFYYYLSTAPGVMQSSEKNSGPFPSANIPFTQNKLCGTFTESTTLTGDLGNQPGLIAENTETSTVNAWPMPLGAAWNTGQSLGGRQWAIRDCDGLVRYGDAHTLPVPTNYTFSNTTTADLGPFRTPMVAITSSASIPYRPIVLNRPFRNVGELGYVLRDQPWKTLSFSLIPYAPPIDSSAVAVQGSQSGDSGLLEVFTLVDSTEQAGKVDLNTGNARVLEAVLRNSESWLVTASTSTPYQLTSADATTIAQNMVASTAIRPVFSVADLATYVTTSSATTAMDAYNNAKWIFPAISASGIAKEQLEGPLRSLSALGTTRTWYLGVDLVVQTGKYAPDAVDESKDFIVESQQRYFVTLILDRFTGELISSRIEPVYE